jgi:2-keto-4-pentenoate hydratase
VSFAIHTGEDVAERFVAARRAAAGLPDYPGERPATLADAYRIQDAAVRLHGGTIAGWKVGKIAPEVEGANRLAGPIFGDAVVQAGDGVDGGAMPVFADGFAAAEAEFLLRIGTAPEPGKTEFTMADARAMVDAVHVGIEVASSPFTGINAHGPAVTVSDFGNNNGLVIGAAVDNWQDTDLNHWPVELRINDEVAGAAIAADMLDGPFGAVRFLAEHLATRGIALTPGQWVSTGAVTGVHKVQVGDRVAARFDASHRVTCTIKAQG